MNRIIWNFLKSYLCNKKKKKKKKKKKRFIPKKPVDCIYNFETKSYYNSQQYYFQSLVFLVLPYFLMLERRCRNLSKTFFYASFSSILSNMPLNPISNSTISAWLTSAFIVSAFNSLKNVFEIFNIDFFCNFLVSYLFTSSNPRSFCTDSFRSSPTISSNLFKIFVIAVVQIIYVELFPKLNQPFHCT